MIKFYTKRFLLIVFSLFVFAKQELSAQTVIAEDKASNEAYADGWKAGTNGGTGFKPWDFKVGANTGMFIGNPANDSMLTAGIDTVAFGMYSTGVPYANATRSFESYMQIGDELTFYWVMNWDAEAGTKGFDFKSDSTTVYNVNNGNFSPAITTSSDTALRKYGINPIFVKLKRINAEEYSLFLSGRDGEEKYSTTINSALAVNGLDFYIGFQKDGNGKRNVYFNNFKITSPAPTSVSDLKLNKDFSIYPNPVRSGANLQLKLDQLSAGKYTFDVYSISGMRIQQNVLNHTGGKAVQTLPLSARLNSGIYFVELIGNSTRERMKLVVE